MEQKELLEKLDDKSSLDALQAYIVEVIKIRGFAEEKPEEIMLLMVEEIGELAKALRKYSGLKTDISKRDKYPFIEEEIADVFIYLLSLCNTLDIRLFDALYQKETVNIERSWN